MASSWVPTAERASASEWPATKRGARRPSAYSNTRSTRWSMSTPDQLLYSTFTAPRCAMRPNAATSTNRSRTYATSPMGATTSWPKPQESPRDRGTPGPPLTSIMS